MTSSPTFLGMPATAPRGVGHLRGDEPFPKAARTALANPQLRYLPEKPGQDRGYIGPKGPPAMDLTAEK